MRLVIFDALRMGILKDGQVYDVSDIVGARAGEWPPVFWVKAIANFGQLRPRIEAAVSKGKGRPLESVHLRAPVLFPSKVIAAPVNYKLHMQEMGVSDPIDQFGVFLKAPSSIIGPGETIRLPYLDRRTDYEAEVGLVVGKTAKDVKAADALGYIFGYTCVMDITVRGKEDRSTRKSFDTFTPVGPVLVTADEIPDSQNIEFKLWLNGALKQHANTSDMFWGMAKLVEYASSVMTLYPGDLVSTGTPQGVGPIKPGDEVTIEVERIGRMSVTVEAK
ncbi:MAG: fumarylacetoacetate hydrolase family protein [Candidatus Rokubacteria bacterium]|nr:fumarylacetoacetate hydrolase family protein [Candidatus Rokubacteria bacterium]